MGKIAIIGGSGLYSLEGLTECKKVFCDTPFGRPSAEIVCGNIFDKEVLFLARHGAHHQFSPAKVNYRANIYALKFLGASQVLSVSACGSLKKEIKPLDFCIPTQFVDRTNQARPHTFFDEGIVVHASLARPVCDLMAGFLQKAASGCGPKPHYGCSYLNMEGPQFSTLAESNLYRQWGLDIIGMTNMTEARLAREAELCFASLVSVTDYDCWHPEHDSVTVETVLSNLNRNAAAAKKVIAEFIKCFPEEKECRCHESLRYAIVTGKDFIPDQTKDKLKLLIGKYI